MRPGEPVCHLCGLPLTADVVQVVREGPPLHFCCDSCRQIHLMLHGEETSPGRSDSQHKEVHDA